MSDDFLPGGYSVPVSGGGNYTKLQQGENRIRILRKPILGHSWWGYTDEQGGIKFGNDRNPNNRPVKPVRIRLETPIPVIAAEAYKHFWAMVVWNYTTHRIEILEVTQKTIQEGIESLIGDRDWGSPLEYDIAIKKAGSGLDTEYTVTPKPKNELTSEIREARDNASINLEALYDGANPFEKSEKRDEAPVPVEKKDDIDIDDIGF